MHEFTRSTDAAGSKEALYAELAQGAASLVAGETDAVANMANVAALIWQFVPRLNWAGFYRVQGKTLVLGPFIGKPACIRIPVGQGVCGTAAARNETQVVPDVHAFPGHIACDSASRSELVVPVALGATIIAVIDLDSPDPGRFDEADARGIEALAAAIASAIAGAA